MNVETSPTLEHLRELVLSVTDDERLSESVRAARLRTVAETLADLRDVAGVATSVIGGSAAVDVLRCSHIMWGPSGGTVRRDALERVLARRTAAQLVRAVQVTGDTPGVNPRPVDVGTGSTGIGAGLPLVRRFALDRDFGAGGTVPVAPGVTAGDVDGDIVVEGVPTAGGKFTIADVGVSTSRFVAQSVADIAHQVSHWTDEAALAMLDQVMRDIADRAGERELGTRLVAAAGGTRVAGADAATLGAALDAAESAAGAAVSGGADGVGMVALVNPANLPRVRRAVAGSWIANLPHPLVAASIGMPAGTAAVVALDGIHLFRDELLWLQAVNPEEIGFEVSANRPLYLAVRKATGVQTVTAIPA